MVGLICAMAIGGCSCSTSGGIKILRIGIFLKALKQDIKRIILPERTVVSQMLHHIKDIFLEDRQVRSVLLITLLYIGLYITGAVMGMWFGYPFLDSLFESTSAAANTGLTCGITDAGMPAALKIMYMFQMWAGRLEFMSIFVLIGFFIAEIKGR